MNSTDPFQHPIINPKYFEDDFDMKTLIDGVKIGYELSQTRGFQSFGSTMIEYPDCANITKYTDPYWECMIRLYSLTIYHPVGKYYGMFFLGNKKLMQEKSLVISTFKCMPKPFKPNKETRNTVLRRKLTDVKNLLCQICKQMKTEHFAQWKFY